MLVILFTYAFPELRGRYPVAYFGIDILIALAMCYCSTDEYLTTEKPIAFAELAAPAMILGHGFENYKKGFSRATYGYDTPNGWTVTHGIRRTQLKRPTASQRISFTTRRRTRAECCIRRSYLADAAKVARSSSRSNQYEACGGGGNGVSF